MSDSTAPPTGPRPRRILLLVGAVGAGKGTQAEALSSRPRASRTSPRATCSVPRCATARRSASAPRPTWTAASWSPTTSRSTCSWRSWRKPAGLARRHPGRIPAHGRPGGGPRPDAGRRTARSINARHLHRRAQRGAGVARRRPLGLPHRRHRRTTTITDPPRHPGHLRPRRHAAGQARRRPAGGRARAAGQAGAADARGGRSTTRSRASLHRIDGLQPIDAVTARDHGGARADGHCPSRGAPW